MTPGQLVKAVAIALDVPEETVTQHDRNLVVAGLRTKGGRGRSAPKVTPMDAARLLVATLASSRIKDSVGIVRAFEAATFVPSTMLADMENLEAIIAAGARRKGEEYSGPKTRAFSDPAIESLPKRHNFIEAVAALITDASAPVAVDQVKWRFGAMTIGCVTPVGLGYIGRKGEIGGRYKLGDRTASEAKKPEPYQLDVYLCGIRQQRDIYGNVILLLGKAFRDGGLPFDTTRDAIDALLGAKKPAKKKAA